MPVFGFEILSQIARSVPARIVGASVRPDVNRLLLVDETVRSIFVFQLPFPNEESSAFQPLYNASYNGSAYKDVEFIASAREELQTADRAGHLAKLPSKLFFTSMEVPGEAR